MPKPRKGEKQGKFMSRCVPAVVKEGKKQKQAVAICLSMWREDGDCIEVKVRDSDSSNIRAMSIYENIWAIYDEDQVAFVAYLFDEDYGEEDAEHWVRENKNLFDDLLDLAHKLYNERGES
jgi:hypothetical protein